VYGFVIFRVSRVGFQATCHFRRHLLECFHGRLVLVSVGNIDESRHVSALELPGRIHRHVEAGNGVLFPVAVIAHPDRVAYIPDADLVDIDVAVVGAALHVGNGLDEIQHPGLLCVATRLPAFAEIPAMRGGGRYD